MNSEKVGPSSPANPNADIITPEDFGRSLISIDDLFSQFYRHIGPNERPFNVTIIKLNNTRLEEWKDDVLKRLSKQKGQVEAEAGVISLRVFLEGFEVLSLNEQYHFDVPITYDQPLELIQEFEKASLEDLWRLGFASVLLKFERLQMSIKLDLARQRYLRIYSQSKDPYEWFLLSKKNMEVFNGKYMPFDLTPDRFKAITDKIGVVLSIKIDPYK